MKRSLNIRTRLALQFAGILTIIQIVCFGIVVGHYLHGMRESFDVALGEIYDKAVGSLEASSDGKVQLRMPKPLDHPERDFSMETLLEARSPEGKIFYQSAVPSGRTLPEPDGVQKLTPNHFTTIKSGGRNFRIETGKVRLGNQDVILRVAVDEQHVWDEIREMSTSLLIAFPILLLLAGFGGYWMAARALKPVDAMIKTTEDITANNLTERLSVANPHDELGRLASVLNGLLNRLESSFERLRRFTADASHELRTPLQAVKSLGEVALQEHQDAEYYRNALSNILEENERMAKLTQSLLTLSRADSGRLTLNKSNVALGDLSREVAVLLEVLAEEKGQKIIVEMESNPKALVDPIVFRQVLINLIDNAIKYSSPSTTIRVVVRSRNKGTEILITDTGPGIPPEHKEKIFERFYRVDKSRSRDLGGSGLGLAITKWAVEAHGGSIDVESNPGKGSTFRISLPSEV
jgi:heavy metal sensor kinase